jgi:hypothetical protein
VVAAARKGQAPLSQVDSRQGFRISESCLPRLLKLADVEDGTRPDVTAAESTELRNCADTGFENGKGHAGTVRRSPTITK